jgi:heme-degrading monooxygenase HmoA
MILTLFRSRLDPRHLEEYGAAVQHTAPLAEAMPGFLGHQVFTAEDGEQLTVVMFESIETQRAWSLATAHKDAAKAGRKRFYTEYTVQVCEVLRESRFVAPGRSDESPSAPA